VIGRWLEQRSDQELARVLTSPMAPFSITKPSTDPRCLVVTALGLGCEESDSALVLLRGVRAPSQSYRWIEKRIAEKHHPCVVTDQYDQLCARFGTARINQLIRDRALRLALGRVLPQRPAPAHAGTT